MRGIHQWLVDSPHKGPVMRKMFPFDDIIMASHYIKHWWPGLQIYTHVNRLQWFQVKGSESVLSALPDRNHSYHNRSPFPLTNRSSVDRKVPAKSLVALPAKNNSMWMYIIIYTQLRGKPKRGNFKIQDLQTFIQWIDICNNLTPWIKPFQHYIVENIRSSLWYRIEGNKSFWEWW